MTPKARVRPPAWGASGGLPGAVWAVLGASWTALTPSWAVLGSSWAALAALVAALTKARVMCFFQLGTYCPLDLKPLPANNGEAGVRVRRCGQRDRIIATS